MYYMMHCPHCGKGLKADVNAAGKKVCCPACKQTFLHPDATELTVRQQSKDHKQLAEAAAAKKAAAEAAERQLRGTSPIVLALALVLVITGGVFAYRYVTPTEAPPSVHNPQPQAAPSPSSTAPSMAAANRDGDPAEPLPATSTTGDATKPIR